MLSLRRSGAHVDCGEHFRAHATGFTRQNGCRFKFDVAMLSVLIFKIEVFHCIIFDASRGHSNGYLLYGYDLKREFFLSEAKKFFNTKNQREFT